MTAPIQFQENIKNDFVKPGKTVEIIAAGMVTAVGGNIDQTLAAVRAGISAYKESDVYNKNFQPMIMSLVPDDVLPPLDGELLNAAILTSRQQRLLRLITPAIHQATAELGDIDVPLMLGGPEKLPGRRSVISDEFLKQLVVQTKAPIDLENSYVFPDGRASGFYALEAAMLLLEKGVSQYVLVGAADTYLDNYLLETMDVESRILAEGVMDAFVPGEAATFLLLKTVENTEAIKIFPPGIAEEVGHNYSNQAYKGDGLSQAINEAITQSSASGIKTVFASFNGESLHSKEWGVSAIRNQKSFDDDYNIIHPADCFGDIGAATGVTLIGLASLGIIQGHYVKPALVWSSSEMEQRAATCIF